MSKLIVVCGPTASGKTALGVALAQTLNGEVVGADSMQIYRGMDIGTAKPTEEEKQGIPHHMIDVADPGEDFSVARYVDLASACVEDILARGKQPILVGGTGLYIDSLLRGRQFAPFEGKIRRELMARLSEQGVEPLYEELQKVDPERAAKLPRGDERRIIRALEIYYETGKTITHHDRESAAQPPRYEAATVFLNYAERSDLWRRIDARVDEMVQQGLIEEVRGLMERGLSPRCTAMQAIGYKEFSAALRGEESLAAAVEEVKLRSRQYAKRQVTWFKRNQGALRWEWKKTPDFAQALRVSTEFLRENGIG